MAEVLKHLVRGEREVMFPRLRQMLEEDGPVFLPAQTAGPAEPLDYPADLAEFRRVRQTTLAFLEGMDEAGWVRLGRSQTKGALSIEDYARFIAEHDLGHLGQLERTRAMTGG